MEEALITRIQARSTVQWGTQAAVKHSIEKRPFMKVRYLSKCAYRNWEERVRRLPLEEEPTRVRAHPPRLGVRGAEGEGQRPVAAQGDQAPARRADARVHGRGRRDEPGRLARLQGLPLEGRAPALGYVCACLACLLAVLMRSRHQNDAGTD